MERAFYLDRCRVKGKSAPLSGRRGGEAVKHSAILAFKTLPSHRKDLHYK